MPCLAIVFEDDIDSPPRHARLAVAQVPGGRFVEIPDTTHLGPFEQPDAVVHALTNFLQPSTPNPPFVANPGH